MTRAFDPATSVGHLLRARRRYDLLRLLLVVLIVVVVLASLVLVLLQGRKIELQGRKIESLVAQNGAESTQITDLLQGQRDAAAGRQKVVNDAIARIAEDQERAIAEHDRKALDLLRRTLGLVNAEVNAPANKEDVR